MPPRLVVPEGLTRLATQMRQFSWYSGDFNAQVPDGLPSTAAAIANLNESARTLVEYQKLAEAENNRMAERFEAAAAAYKKVDDTYKDALDNPGRQTAIDSIPIPAPSTALPPIPDGPAAPRGLDASGYSDVEQTHDLLEHGDKGASLASIRSNAEVAGDFVLTHAWAQTPTDWEGDAAHAAFTRLNSFTEWLGELAAAWKRLGDAAEKIKGAHDTAYTQHMPVWVQYISKKAQLEALMASGSHVGASVASQAAIQQAYAEMEKLQHQSDEIRQGTRIRRRSILFELLSHRSDLVQVLRT